MAGMRTVAAATSLVFTLGLVCFVRPGFAQQPDSAGQRPDSSLSAEALKKLSIEQLMNLQVTSVSKRPERLSQTASAIQVITQEDIRRSGAASLAEALRLAANLQVAQIDSRQWAISARGFGGTEQHGFGTVRYGAALGSHVRARIYVRGFDRDATAFPGGQDAADDWHLGQGGFRMDWEASSASRVTLQSDLYDGRIAQ